MNIHKYVALQIMAVSCWILAFSISVEFKGDWFNIPMIIGWIIWGMTTGYQWGYRKAERKVEGDAR